VGTPPSHSLARRARPWTIVVFVFALAASAAIPAVLAAGPPNEKRVKICHATSSRSNPYVENEPAIANNGDLEGGHLNHKGPAFPADDWGDIIQPYTYVGEDGEEHVYLGSDSYHNGGAAILQNDCKPVTPPEPPGASSITVVKNLSPTDDPGRFDLKIGEDAASGVGHGGTKTIAVPAGEYVVSESAADGTSLDDYEVAIVCRNNKDNEIVTGASGPSVKLSVSGDQAITCTITNTKKPKQGTVTPTLECVAFRDGAPDVAYWGYKNTNDHPVVIPKDDDRDENFFAPGRRDRGQPAVFEVGTVVGQFETAFDASGTLTWTVAGRSVSADADSKPCTATLEVRKVVQPASDPGVFVLEVNDRPVVTGGNGVTTGPIVVGAGEGTSSEVAGPGTSLADYDSRVDCTRNGQPAASAAGTKIDSAVANGDVVVCTFTNVRKATSPTTPKPPKPRLLDLEVVKTAKPTVVRVGGRITWTMIVTNRSTVEAADVNGVKVDDPRSFRAKRISLKTSQGTCRPYRCDLGRLAPGASATVVAVTEATQVGPIVNIVRVGSEEQESNYRNNVAAAIVQVVEPGNRCGTLVAEPRALQSGRSSVVRLTARNPLGRRVAGVRVLARGPGVDRRGVTDRQGVARLAVSPGQLGLVHFIGSPRRLVGGGSPCRTLLGVLGASDTKVTG
jgi:uncharacterized repeat protein (TIGR01451 family)